jgi:branched-chain amino acid transport system permease protein
MTQLMANTVLAAAVVVLLGLGFGLIYRISHFFHVAHGAVFTAGAYGLYLLVHVLGVGLFIAIPITVALSALLGASIDRVIHRPLRRRKATPVVHLIASLGLYTGLTNVFALCFGDQTLTIRGMEIHEGMSFLGAHLTPIQQVTIAAASVIVALVVILEQRTNAGLRYRAVATDPTLAVASGVPVDTVLSRSFVLGSAIAGIAGVLVGLDVDIRPNMGLGPLLLAVVAVVIGGVGSIPGLVLGAILITVIQNIVGWYLGQQWRESAAFALLVLFLLFRPRGIQGTQLAERSER